METELERIIAETNLLQDLRRALEKAKQDCEQPLHTALECLYHREGRQGRLEGYKTADKNLKKFFFSFFMFFFLNSIVSKISTVFLVNSTVK